MRGVSTLRRTPGGEFPLQPPGPRPAGFPGRPGAAAPGPGNSPVHRAGCRPYRRSVHFPESIETAGQGERAETYLRLLVEQALRSAADGRADSRGEAPGGPGVVPSGASSSGGASSASRRRGGIAPLSASRVRNSADTLVDAGVLTDTVAAEIVADLNVALRVRGWQPTGGLAGRLRRMRGFIGQGEPADGQPPPWRVLPAGPGTPASRLMAVILTADRALTPATLFFPPADGPPESRMPPFAQLTGTDDLGTDYRLGFSEGTWAGSAWTGTVMFYPAPPAAARWLEIMSPNGALLRADIATAPQGRASSLLDPVAETPGERLLTRRAEAMLVRLALGYQPDKGHPGLDEVVATLEGAGALAPLSPAPARLAALGQLLGLPTEGPADEIPPRWTRLMAYYGRRKRLAAVTGTASIAAELPEIDGARFAVAGLRSGGAGTFLHVLAEVRRLGRPIHRSGQAPASDTGFSWWVRDDADGWHLCAVEDVDVTGGRDGMLRFAVLPPLGHATTRLTAEVRGATQQVRANLPVHW
jgi:hypothetical protein